MWRRMWFDSCHYFPLPSRRTAEVGPYFIWKTERADTHLSILFISSYQMHNPLTSSGCQSRSTYKHVRNRESIICMRNLSANAAQLLNNNLILINKREIKRSKEMWQIYVKYSYSCQTSSFTCKFDVLVSCHTVIPEHLRMVKLTKYLYERIEWINCLPSSLSSSIFTYYTRALASDIHMEMDSYGLWIFLIPAVSDTQSLIVFPKAV